jgi:hypothetical protein
MDIELDEGYYEMYTRAGNDEVDIRLNRLESDITGGRLRRPFLERRITDILEEVRKAGHDEVYDTSVREAIYARVDKICDREGWKRVYE